MRLLICDDHAIFREGLKTILAGLDALFFEAATSDEALAILIANPDIDVVLLDIEMPGRDGWSALQELRAHHPGTPCVVVSAHDEAGLVARALDNGASGFIPKSSAPSLFRTALQLVLDGEVYVPPQILERLDGRLARSPRPASAADDAPRLTPRQREILAMLARGQTNAEIGASLGIAAGTVKAHLSALFLVLGVSNRTEAALKAQQLRHGRE